MSFYTLVIRSPVMVTNPVQISAFPCCCAVLLMGHKVTCSMLLHLHSDVSNCTVINIGYWGIMRERETT
jgi:hypothetical protein